MTRFALAIALAAALAAACASGGCERQLDAAADHLGGEVDVPGDPAFDAVALVRKGPLVQDVGPDHATFVWETDVPARSIVEVVPAPSTPAAPGSHSAAGPARRAEGRTFVVNFLPGLRRYEPRDAFVHEVRVNGLSPSATYAYRIVSVVAPASNKPAAGGTFRTSPEGAADFTAVLFGDNRGSGARFGAVITAALAHHPSLVVATGDLVGEGTNENDWQTFMDVGAALLRDVPFYSTLGNHDVYAYGIPRFDAYFAPPPPPLPYATGRKWVPDGENVYSFDWGRAHFLMLNSNETSGTVDLQAEWIRRDLAAARARGASPVVAFMHHPMFTLADHAPSLVLRDKWWKLLRDGGVGAVVAGHNHVYERFEVEGVVAITSGGAGAPTYDPDVGPTRREAPLRKASAARLHVIRLDVRAVGDAAGTVIDAETGEVFDTFRVPAR